MPVTAANFASRTLFQDAPKPARRMDAGRGPRQSRPRQRPPRSRANARRAGRLGGRRVPQSAAACRVPILSTRRIHRAKPSLGYNAFTSRLRTSERRKTLNLASSLGFIISQTANGLGRAAALALVGAVVALSLAACDSSEPTLCRRRNADARSAPKSCEVNPPASVLTQAFSLPTPRYSAKAGRTAHPAPGRQQGWSRAFWRG